MMRIANYDNETMRKLLSPFEKTPFHRCKGIILGNAGLTQYNTGPAHVNIRPDLKVAQEVDTTRLLSSYYKHTGYPKMKRPPTFEEWMCQGILMVNYKWNTNVDSYLYGRIAYNLVAYFRENDLKMAFWIPTHRRRPALEGLVKTADAQPGKRVVCSKYTDNFFGAVNELYPDEPVHWRLP